MNIKWYSNNHDTDPQGLSPNYQMIENFLGNYPDSKEELIYFIIGDKLDRNSIFSKFIENVNIYRNFNIELGFASEENDPNFSIPVKPTFFIGNDAHFQSLVKMSGPKTIVSCVGNKDIETIGYQRHLSENCHSQSISLGELNQGIDKAESILRKAEIVLFDINAIKRQESFSSRSKVTGLTILESCTLARAIGMSPKNKVFFINVGNEDFNDQSQEVIALLLWYYLEGLTFNNLETEDTDSTTYLVENKHFDEPVKFSKGKITGRWSFVHPIDLKSYPCTEAEYHEFSKGALIESMVSLVEN